MKTWWVKASVRGRGVDRTLEGEMFYTLRYAPKPTPKPTPNQRQYDPLTFSKAYYVARWSPTKGKWEAIWQNELDEMREQGRVPPF